MKSNKGFIVLLIPLLTLFTTGFLSLSLIGIGIKNSTALQSICLKKTLAIQKHLKEKLEALLDINQEVLSLHNKRRKVLSSIAVSTSLGLAPALPLLKTKLKLIELKQKKEYIKQKLILYKSKKIKQKIVSIFKKEVKSKFKKIRISNIKSRSLSRKPLALDKKKLNAYSYLYFPQAEFSKHQAIDLSWQVNPFYPMSDWILRILKLKMNPLTHQTCKSTLKRRHQLWQAHLTY